MVVERFLTKRLMTKHSTNAEACLKWQPYGDARRRNFAKGLIERIGLKDSVSTVNLMTVQNRNLDIAGPHVQAVKILLDDLIRFDIIKSYDEITGVGHRGCWWRIFQRIKVWWMKMPWLRLKNCQPEVAYTIQVCLRSVPLRSSSRYYECCCF